MTQYAVVSEFNEMSLRIDHDVNSTKIESIVMHTVMLADSLWTAPADGTSRKAGDVWAHIVSVNQVAKNGWVAVKHLGDVYCTYSDTASPISVDAPTEIISKPLPASEEAGIFTTLTYGNDFMVAKMGLDTIAMGTTNFQNIDLFTPADGFKSVSVFQRLSKTELDYLIKLQPKDKGTFESKMAFLCSAPKGTPDRPYWTRGGTWEDLHSGKNTNVSFDFGTLVFGGQKIKVETDVNKLPIVYTFRARYQSETDKDIRPLAFYKLEGMRKADIGKYTHATHPWFIQKCTWAGKKKNQYHDTWNSGIVYHPVWSPLDYPTNNGSNALYIAKEFCE